MERQRRRDTQPELALRRELHGRGLRYRVDRRPVQDLRIRADIVFGAAKVAVFVDGCFWHMCPEHSTIPKHNRDWWLGKLRRNADRDANATALLESAGWSVVRVWEHEPVIQAADRVERLVLGKQCPWQPSTTGKGH